MDIVYLSLYGGPTCRKGGTCQELYCQLRKRFNFTLNYSKDVILGEVGDPILSEKHRMQHL